MSDYPKDIGSGVLFPVEGRENEYQGNIEIGENKHRITAVKTTTRKGQTLYSLQVEIGALFVVEEKRNPNGPDMTGKLEVEGDLVRAAGWHKKAKNTGNAFISLNISESRDQPAKAEEPAPAKVNDSEIPF